MKPFNSALFFFFYPRFYGIFLVTVLGPDGLKKMCDDISHEHIK